MTANGWFQIGLYLLVIILVTRPMGVFMTRVFNREKTFLDPIFRPIERLVYRLTGIDEKREMRWTEYAIAMLLFSGVSMALLYVIERTQKWLPFNPQKFANVDPALAFGTAASFTTNTNWQAYSGESTMSYFTQMAGLAYHNFASAAVGIVLAIVVIRGIARKETDKLGNFWVDTTRCLLWVLLPICIVGSLVFVSQGVVQNLKPYTTVQLIEPQTVQVTGTNGKTITQTVTQQVIAQGPVASQEVIKEFGTNGGGKSHSVFKLFPTSVDFCDSVRVDLHPRTHDRITASRLGSLGGHGLLVLGRCDDRVLGGSEGQSAFGRHRPASKCAAIRRKHGGQGSALRHREFHVVCHGNH